MTRLLRIQDGRGWGAALKPWHLILLNALCRAERLVSKYRDAQRRLYAHQSLENDWCSEQAEHWSKVASWIERRLDR